MDFGEILDTWENNQKQKKHSSVMEEALDSYLPKKRDCDAKKAQDYKKNTKNPEHRQMLTMLPQREIDLHGYKAREALDVLDKFIKQCKKDNIIKILIIHGKGNHSVAGPVLQKKILHFIQACPLTGEYGFAHRTMGGKGAMWVILR